jgi:hypothetical protein
LGFIVRFQQTRWKAGVNQHTPPDAPIFGPSRPELGSKTMVHQRMKNQSSSPKSPADTSRKEAAKEWSRQNDEQRSTRAATQDPEVERNETRHAGAHRDESGQSGEQRSEQRVQRPGEAGLANENRPGLGTRAEGGDQPDPRDRPVDVQRQASDQGQTTKRPEPREQKSDSLAQEQQRSTGMSGMSSGT